MDDAYHTVAFNSGMSDHHDPKRPTLPLDPTLMADFVRERLGDFFTMHSADILNTLTHPRTGVANPNADDCAPYRAVARFYATGGTNEAEKGRHKTFLLDQRLGPILRELARGTVWESCGFAPEDQGRATALVARWLAKYPVADDINIDKERCKVVSTLGYEDEVIHWNPDLDTRLQAPEYINKIDLASLRHEKLDPGNTMPITAAHKTARLLFNNKSTGRATGELPERFTEQFVADKPRPAKGNWPAFCKVLIEFDMGRPNVAGSGSAPAPSSVFAAGRGGSFTGRDDSRTRKLDKPWGKMTEAEQKDFSRQPCKHFHSDKGCGFEAKDCRQQHVGNGKLNKERIAARKAGAKPGGKGAPGLSRGSKGKVAPGKYQVRYTSKGEPEMKLLPGSSDEDDDQPAPKKQKQSKKGAAKGKKAAGNGWMSVNFLSQVIMIGLALADLPGAGAVTEPVHDCDDHCYCGDCCKPSAYNVFVSTDDAVPASGDNYKYRVNVSNVANRLRHPSKLKAAFMIIYDSGATVSVKRDRFGFNSDYHRVYNHPPIRVANGSYIPVLGIGSITVKMMIKRNGRMKWQMVTIRNVLHADAFDVDVLSRNQLRREGFKFECDSETDTMTTPQGGTVDLVEKDGTCTNERHSLRVRNAELEQELI